MPRKIPVPDSRIAGLKALVPALRELSNDDATWLADSLDMLRPLPRQWGYTFENYDGKRLDCCDVWGGKASPRCAGGLTEAKRMAQRLADEHNCAVFAVRSCNGQTEHLGTYCPSRD